MAKKEKGIAVFAATVGYLTLNVVMSVYLKATGTLADPAVAAQVGQGTVLGIQTLKIEAMGGLIAGLVAAKVADKFLPFGTSVGNLHSSAERNPSRSSHLPA